MRRFVIAASSDTVKPLSKAELERCNKAKAIVMKCYESETEDYYEEEGDEVYSEPDPTDPNVIWTIDKGWLVYTDSWDENERKVKRGGKVPGSTFYSVTCDGDVWDERNIAQLTLADAQHFLKICQQDRAAWSERWKSHK